MVFRVEGLGSSLPHELREGGGPRGAPDAREGEEPFQAHARHPPCRGRESERKREGERERECVCVRVRESERGREARSPSRVTPDTRPAEGEGDFFIDNLLEGVCVCVCVCERGGRTGHKRALRVSWVEGHGGLPTKAPSLFRGWGSGFLVWGGLCEG